MNSILKQWIAPVSVSLVLFSCGQQEAPEAQETATNKYEEYVSAAAENGQFNGNVLVLKAGEVVYQGSFGLKNIEPMDSLDLNTAFRLASVSKQFTCMGIMILKEQGKLDYDQDIRDFIPELPYEGITVRHLIHHVSGLPDYVQLFEEHWKTDLDDNDRARAISGNDDIINALAEHRPAVYFEPETEWQYSNTGYVLLASIVSRVSGMSFADFMKANVFEPAGMASTVVYKYVEGPDPELPNKAFGFTNGFMGIGRGFEDYHFLNHAQGDGGIFSTLEDLKNWDRALYTEKLVPASTLDEAFTPCILANGDTTEYGFGWGVEFSEDGKKVVQHSGGWVGFATYIHREIEDDNCLIVLTNNSSSNVWGVIGGLLDLMHDEEAEAPKASIREHIGSVVLTDGIEAALAEYDKLRSEQSEAYNFREMELNILGYELMGMDKNEEAAAVLKLNLEQFPGSANPYDSYGDALLAIGDTANAILNFEKAFEMDSTMAFIPEKIKKLTD